MNYQRYVLTTKVKNLLHHVWLTHDSLVIGEVQPEVVPVVVRGGAQRVQRAAEERARAAAAQRARRLPHAQPAQAERQPRARPSEAAACANTIMCRTDSCKYPELNTVLLCYVNLLIPFKHTNWYRIILSSNCIRIIVVKS